MRLYAGTTEQFVQDATQNRIAERLRASFLSYFRYQPPPSEVRAWGNSLRAMSLTIQHAELRDVGVMLEYQLPLTSRRLDCMLLGHDAAARDQAVVVELKQWESCSEADGDNELITWLGGDEREVLHPSVQVGQYHMYLRDTHAAFHEGDAPVGLSSCSYLHNYPFDAGDPLFAGKFTDAVEQFPVFTADDVDRLSEYLVRRVGEGGGGEVLPRVEQSRYRPSKALMRHAGTVLKGIPEYVLLDEQLVVYDKVFALAKSGFADKKKHVLIIRGGPGTGKSVIAVNVLADLLLADYNAQHATGSKAFTETLKKVVGTRASAQFKWFNSYAKAQLNEIDVLVCDEAHRLRTSSTSWYTPRQERSALSQVEELLHAAKVTVFFLDDLQAVRPGEIGSASYIRSAAEEMGCIVHEYGLEAQFRCNGSESFIGWVENTLGITRTANVIWDRHDEFDFRIFPSAEALEAAIREKADAGHSARVTAGFCWPWSDPRPDGTLVDDVVVGSFRRPWNASPKARRLAPGIPKASVWAHDPNGIEQVGCVYTAQGFEFDYVGVIFGKDLRYDLDQQRWVAHREHSRDRTVKRAPPAEFLNLVRNTYRVLLTRGMKGCYVCFEDKDTERFFKSRIE
jgi:DUF2075 family protein